MVKNLPALYDKFMLRDDKSQNSRNDPANRTINQYAMKTVFKKIHMNLMTPNNAFAAN